MQFLALAVALTIALPPPAAAVVARGDAHRLRGPGEGGGASEAVQRLEAVEDQRTSRVLCRLSGSDGQGMATVRLQPTTNTRSLVFNDDVMGVETRVRCSGPVAPECLAQEAPSVSKDVQECPACPCDKAAGQLYGKYAVATAEVIDGRCGGRTADAGPLRVLMLGLGAGELAAHVSSRCGTSVELEAVELDGRLPSLATRYFGMPSSVKVTVGDAGPEAAALLRAVEADQLLADGRRYDVVLVDCFSTGGVTPEHCRSADFVNTMKPLLRDGGVVMQHLWHVDEAHAEVAEEFQATVALYQKVFQCPGCAVSVQALQGPDSLVVASVPASTAEN